jgi:glycosyltransferase involved in cell wall biosynthesis
MLAGGGPVITTTTGGIAEAVGDTAMIVPVGSPHSIADALDVAVTMPSSEQAAMAARARAHAMQFDRAHVFDRLLERLIEVTERGSARSDADFLPDRDMARAVAGEWLTFPTGPALP